MDKNEIENIQLRKLCPQCGSTVRLKLNDRETVVTFVCEPDSPCIGSGLLVCCLPVNVETAVEAWERRV